MNTQHLTQPTSAALTGLATLRSTLKTLRLTLIAGSVLLTLLASRIGANADVTGDYRSAASGNWDVAATWETYNGSAWVVASSKPTATNPVFIQAGHVVTLTGNEACLDLQISTGTTSATVGGDGQVALVTYTLDINGKLRCYFGAVGGSGNLPGTSSTAVPTSPITKTSGGAGEIRFVGNTRNITTTGEWIGSAPVGAATMYAAEVALNAGQTVSLAGNVGTKPSSWNLTSGTLNATAQISADNGTDGQGDITIGASATAISDRTGNASSALVIGRTTSATKGGNLTVNGLLQMSGAAPNIAMNAISFSGTVEYTKSGNQVLAVATGAGGGASPNTYNNLTLSGSGVKTLGLNTTVNGTLTFGGTASLALGGFTLTFGSSASQTLSGVISGTGALVQNGPGTLTLTATNTYSATTTVAGGKLVGRVGGSATNSVVTVNNTAGCTLGLAVTDNTKQWSCSNLTFAGTSAALEVDFGALTPNGSLAPLKVYGDVTFTGTPTVTIVGTVIPNTTATYPLATWTGAANPANAPTAVTLPSPLNGNLSLSGDGKTLNLNIVAAATQPLTWTAGTGTWNTSTANWTNALGSAVAYTDTSDNVVFSDAPSGSGPFAVTLNSSFSPISVLVSNATKNYTISGSGGIAGTTGLIKNGAGTLTFSVANTFTGGTTVSNGTLALSGSGTLGASSGALVVPGGTVDLGGTSQSAGTVTLSGGTIQNGTLTGTCYALQSGAVSAALAGGVAVTKTTAGTVTLSGASTYTGGTALNSGKLQVNAAETAGVSGPLGASGSISFGGGTLQYSSANTYDYSSRFTSPTAVNIDVNGQAVTFASVITSSCSLTLGDSSGGGSLTLTASDAYSGGTTINAGTLRLSGAFKAGSTSAPMTINGGTFDLNGSTVSVTVGTFNGGTGAQVINGGGNTIVFQVCNSYTGSTANFQGVISDGSGSIKLVTKHTTGVFTLSGPNTYSDDTTITSGGLVKLAHSQALQNTTLLNPEGIVFDSSVASHAFTFGGLSSTNNLALQDNAGSPNNVALAVGNNNASTTYAGILSGGGSCTKIGTGRLILTGTNTYTGATVVSNGMLAVNGAIAGSTTVKSNATLGGSGTVNAPVIVETGGTISPATFANNVAKLTTGALTLSGGATNVFEIHSATGTAGTDWDLVDAGANNVDVQSTSGSPFTFKLASSSLNNFNKDTAYSWPAIAGNVLNFAADKFAIDAAGFTNDLAGGYFFIAPGSLNVAFTNNHSPTASPVTYSFANGVSIKPFTIPIATFLANNTADADGDARALVSLTSTNALVSTNATDITISSNNGLTESISYVVRDLRSTYRVGDSVRMATNYINILRTNAVGAVTIANLGATNMALSFYGIPDYQYVIQRSTDMSAWTDVVTNTAATNGLIQFTETPPYNPAFYRIRQY